jgi:hypothetical protein
MPTVRKDHYRKAIRLIKGLDIAVIAHSKRSALDSSANCWHVPSQSINIGTKDHAELVLLSVVHELGHCLSVRRGSKTDRLTYLLYLGNAKLTKKQRDSILKEERECFRLGLKFARDSKLPVTDWMLYARRVMVNSHVKKLKGLAK